MVNNNFQTFEKVHELFPRDFLEFFGFFFSTVEFVGPVDEFPIVHDKLSSQTFWRLSQVFHIRGLGFFELYWASERNSNGNAIWPIIELYVVWISHCETQLHVSSSSFKNDISTNLNQDKNDPGHVYILIYRSIMIFIRIGLVLRLD